MNLTARRRLAASLALVLAPLGALAASPTPVAQAVAPAAAGTLTKYGFNTVASGTIIRAQNAEVRSGRTALVTQACTRMTGTYKEGKTALATPANDYINVSAITTTSRTYYRAATRTHGTRATSTIGDVAIGNADTGRLTLSGVRVFADSFHKPAGYGNAAGMTWADIGLQLPGGQEVPPEVQDLLDAIQTQVVGEVVKVLQQYGTIEIPGFGTIALGERWRQKGPGFASAWSHGLVIRFTGDGTMNEVILGQAHTRIGGPAPLATFRSNLQAMDVKALDGAIHYSRVGGTNLPCEGTRGTIGHKRVASSSVTPLQVPITVQGVDNSYSGKQVTSTGLVTGWANAHIDKATISGVPGVTPELVFNNINAKVTVSRPKGKPVATGVTTSVGSLYVDGVKTAMPRPGQVKSLGDYGTIESRIVDRGKLGAKVQAVRVTLFAKNIEILFGWSYNSVWPK